MEMNATKKRQDATAVIELLAETFPRCFAVYAHIMPKSSPAREAAETLNPRTASVCIYK